jgi:superfamily II DNA or RNA helicase
MAYDKRAYQDEAVERTRDALRAKKLRPLLVAPTGSGKTIIACRIVKSAAGKEKRVLFVTHRQELVTQISDTLTEVAIEHGILQGTRTRDTDRPILVASVQTLQRRLARPDHGLGPFDLIIFDEAHHATADGYQDVLAAFPGVPVLGLTATPYRADGKALGEVFDALVVVSTIQELIDLGYLVPPRLFKRDVPDLSRVKKSKLTNDYDLGDLDRVMNRIEFVEDTVQAWKKDAAGRTTVAFAVSIEHSLHLRDAFLRAGVRAGHVDGEMRDKARAAVLEDLKEGRLDVVVNCNILTEGWDLPRCSCIILARPTRSRSLWRQMCGRALRPDHATGKVDCLILDHAGCDKRFGSLTAPDRISLLGHESDEEAPGFHCPFCAAELQGWPKRCPSCGATLPRGGPPVELPAQGPMVEVTPEVRAQDERTAFYASRARLARTYGRSPGSVASVFYMRFKRYPKRSDMGTDTTLWTQYDDVLRRRVWIKPIQIAMPLATPLATPPNAQASVGSVGSVGAGAGSVAAPPARSATAAATRAR